MPKDTKTLGITKPGLVKVWALCIKKGCASVLTQPLAFYFSFPNLHMKVILSVPPHNTDFYLQIPLSPSLTISANIGFAPLTKHSTAMKGILIGTIALIYLLTFFILRASTRLVKVLGETGNNVMMRLMGLILMVIAVECFVSGAKPILADIVREGLSGICK